MYVKQCRTHDFTFSKYQKNMSVMHAHAFFCMSTSICTRILTFPKGLKIHIFCLGDKNNVLSGWAKLGLIVT